MVLQTTGICTVLNDEIKLSKKIDQVEKVEKETKKENKEFLRNEGLYQLVVISFLSNARPIVAYLHSPVIDTHTPPPDRCPLV